MDIERKNFLKECEAEARKNDIMKKKQTFDQFKKEFETILMERHGLVINDCSDEEQLMVEYESGSTPIEFVEWIETKHSLDRIDLEPFTFKKKI